MNSLLFQLVAFASSFLLILPAGWCSGSVRDSVESAPVEAMCCHQACDEAASDPSDLPVQSSIDCCCAWEATMPQRGAELHDSSSPAILLTGAEFTTDHGSVKASETISTPFRHGPRMHVLKCVWRC